MNGKQGLSVTREQDQIGFPMARLFTRFDMGRARCNRDALPDVIDRRPAFSSTPPAFAFSLGQIMAEVK